MSKKDFNNQAEKLKNLVNSARLQTSSAAAVSDGNDANPVGAAEPIAVEQQSVVEVRPEPPKTKAKNLKAIPVSYFEAHSDLKSSSKTSLDFSSYIIEAIREKLERDGAIGN